MTTMPEPASRTLDVNGLRVHYLDWGNLGAPPILCVHGYTSSAQAFNALARRLRDRHHVVAPDVRGHGESGWSPSGAYQYENQVGDLARSSTSSAWRDSRSSAPRWAASSRWRTRVRIRIGSRGC
jgi:pimeloyl-ACP methyl ester carboxylesterase